MNPSEDAGAPAPPTPVRIAEVRFPLPALLDEIKAERATSTFAMERLDQTEIGKLFKSKVARGKPKTHQD